MQAMHNTVETNKTVVTWQQSLAHAINRLPDLLQALALTAADIPELDMARLDFPLRVPREFIAKMQQCNAHDPLLRQVLPLTDERQTDPLFQLDPLQEKQFKKAPGLLHKYRSRVLLILSSSCAINCRYCFRRHFPYTEHHPQQQGWAPAIDYIRTHPEVKEVILSGGDPLLMDDLKLKQLITELSTVTHLRYVRIHTRLPIVIPQRITEQLIDALTCSRLIPSMVLHSNHPNELDQTLHDALLPLRQAGVQLLNQAVLLKGVNDSTATLTALSYALYDCGILPYYLHLLDPVQGTQHFEVDEARAQVLQQALRAELPGYLMPQFVRETAGEHSKRPIG